MKFLARPTIIGLLLISSGWSFDLKSQTRADNKLTPATISGKVTLKGKGVSGIVVILQAVNRASSQASRYRGTTDQDGNYQISDIPPGSYRVGPEALAFAVVSPELLGVTLIVEQGESVENIDFILTKGGVITGRVTNTEGQPVIEQEITLDHLDASHVTISQRQSWKTDDRGVYRIFGLSQGKYKVAVRHDEATSFGGRSRGQRLQTFYPDVTDSSKAAIVEVAEGGEVTGVDITVETTEPVGKFAVTGRIIDGVTGQPVPNSRIGLQVVSADQVSFGMSPGLVSDNNGLFRLENLDPGKYGIYVPPLPPDGLRSDLVPFEIVNGDVTGLVVKTYQGASVSGQIIYDGNNDKLIRSRPLLLFVNVSNETQVGNPGQMVRIKQDATFQVVGLPAGTVNFSLSSLEGGPRLSISRVERDGIILPGGFEIKNGEQVMGLKVVVNASSGIIRGVVKVANGELPPRANIAVWFTYTARDATGSLRPTPSPIVDSRGHFVAEGVIPGTYELNATIYFQDGRNRSATAKQEVTVIDGAVTEVTITLDLPPEHKLR